MRGSFCRVLCCNIVLLIGLTSLAAAQDSVRAKVGIRVKSGDSAVWAKTRDSIRAGDFLRVYVLPEDDAYIYLIYSDNKTPTLLNSQTYKKKMEKGMVAAFPSESEFYQTDGTSPLENFVVICSPKEMQEVPTLFNSPKVSQENWRLLEADLMKRSKIELDQKAEKPFIIAGNVRGLTGEKSPEVSLTDLLTFSGKSFVVKKYEFAVKK
jgi:hypothetical protein